MIGGADLVIDGPTWPEDADFVVRSLRSLWPDAVLQGVNERAARSIRSIRFPVGTPAEVLIYRDPDSFVSWDTHGATEDNQDALVHLIVSPKSVTVVVDRHDSPLADAIREVLRAVQRNRVVLPKAA